MNLAMHPQFGECQFLVEKYTHSLYIHMCRTIQHVAMYPYNVYYRVH